jgi:hypothetical protein
LTINIYAGSAHSTSLSACKSIRTYLAGYSEKREEEKKEDGKDEEQNKVKILDK